MASPEITQDVIRKRETVGRWFALALVGVLLLALVWVLRIGIPWFRLSLAQGYFEMRLLNVGVHVARVGEDVFHGKIGALHAHASVRGQNRLTDDDLLRFRDFKNLQSLQLADCGRITDRGLAALEGLTDLRELDLGGDKKAPAITDGGLDHLKGLKRLTNLSLANTRITDAGLAKLSGLTRLEFLDLEGTHVTDASLEWIARLPKLEDVVLGRTQVSREGLLKLQLANPTLAIHDDGEFDAMNRTYGGRR
jgi:hypothetical protein